MKVVYFLLLILVLGGCSQSLLGTYITVDSDSFNQVEFEFKSDSILEIRYWSDVLGESRKVEKWYKIGDTVYTSNNRDKSEIFTYYFDKNGDDKNLRIVVLDKFDSAGINLAHVSINDDLDVLKSNGNGVYTVLNFAQDSIKSINVKYLNQNNKIVLNDGVSGFNEIRIYFDFEKSTSNYTHGQLWLCKGKKIYSLEKDDLVMLKKKASD